MPGSSTSAGGGGAATQAGMTYQSRIAAWLYVRMLAGIHGPAIGELADVTIETVRSETDQPVDDILVEFSGGSRVLVQAKHGLASVSANADSAFCSVIRQFVQQAVLRRATQPSSIETMVLVVDPSASGTIRNELRSLWERFASAPSGLLSTVPSNVRERELNVLIEGVIDREWLGLVGAPPTPTDVEDLLRRVRVRVLDVDPQGSDERAARDLFQTTILGDGTGVEAAWALTVEYASQAVKNRGWVDRLALQHHLSERGVSLRAALDDRGDIERLLALSKHTAAGLSRHRSISFGGTEVHIERDVLGQLRSAAPLGSLVIVGDPGSGKSALLHDLATALAAEHDVVLLAADTLDESGIALSAGITRELDIVLRQWPGTRPGILIVDALDAARSERGAAQLRDLIERVRTNAPRWRVVASIRRYDLRYGTQLARLFAGTPPADAIDAEFAKVRHVAVGRLSAGEVTQLLKQMPALADGFAGAPANLVTLLGNVFNVRLFAEILAAGVAVDSLHSVGTQAELLERYWGARVLSGTGAERDARELVLTRTVDKMVSARALRANRRDIADASGALDALLSANVLVEWRPTNDARPVRAVVAFAHHIVFDYAVECLHLRPDPGPVTLIEADPSLVVAIRPSLVLHFQYLWTEEPAHRRFWSLSIELAASARVPEIAKIIGPLVASENVTELDDFVPVLDALADGSRADQADRVLQHVIGAAVAGSKAKHRPLVGDAAGPWCELGAEMTRRETRGVAWAITILLRAVCEGSNTLTARQAAAAGRAARWLFDYVMTPANYNSFWIRDPIRFVARTFSSSPTESAMKLRTLLTVERSDVQLQAEIAALASESEHFIRSDPELGRDVYAFVFTLDARSNESVPLGPGRILGLNTTVDQQLDHARYLLAQAFPVFLAAAPPAAAEALGLAVEDYVRRRHPLPSGEQTEEGFVFRAKQTSIITDYSEVWDSSGTYSGDYPLEMFDSFETALSDSASGSGLDETWMQALTSLLNASRRGIVWRRLLRAATRKPETLGRELRELTWTAAILAAHDTSVPAGEFLRAVFPLLEAAEKRRVETCILQLPTTDAGQVWSTLGREHIRDRLLGCLPEPITVAAQTRVAELSAQTNGPPENRSAYQTGTVQSRRYTTVDYLRDRGVAVDEPANAFIRGLAEPLATFAERFNGTPPDAAARDDVLPRLTTLFDALGRADSEGVDSGLRNYAWGVAAHAAGRIVWCHDFDANGRDAIVLRTLLVASHNVEPEFRPEADASFNQSASWGSPAARLDAAAGLIVIAGQAATPDVEVAIRLLAGDAVAAVRYQVFAHLGGLFAASRTTFNDLLDGACAHENNRGVLRVVIDRVLRPLAGEEPRRAVELTRLIYDRTIDGEGSEHVREACISMFVRVHLWKQDTLARDILRPLVERPAPKEAGRIAQCLRSALTVGSTDQEDISSAMARQEAISLMTRLSGAVRAGIELELSTAVENRTKEDNERIRELVQLADNLGREVYFGSGAYDAREGSEKGARDRIGKEAHRRFLAESVSLLDALISLSDIGVPSLTHHLLQTLESFIQVEPARSFRRIADLVVLGARGGYQLETLALTLVVRLLERFLADHRDLLQEPENQRRLIAALDVFVEAGWPEAWELTYRLDEIFR